VNVLCLYCIVFLDTIYDAGHLVDVVYEGVDQLSTDAEILEVWRWLVLTMRGDVLDSLPEFVEGLCRRVTHESRKQQRTACCQDRHGEQ
jgi:hypothetical protein